MESTNLPSDFENSSWILKHWRGFEKVWCPAAKPRLCSIALYLLQVNVLTLSQPVKIYLIDKWVQACYSFLFSLSQLQSKSTITYCHDWSTNCKVRTTRAVKYSDGAFPYEGLIVLGYKASFVFHTTKDVAVYQLYIMIAPVERSTLFLAVALVCWYSQRRLVDAPI